MERLEIIKLAWLSEDVEPMLRVAQEDIRYLIEQLEEAQRERDHFRNQADRMFGQKVEVESERNALLRTLAAG